ncbi:unnamed protein product [Porites lobata]|uniref:Interleukin-1 receptor-associated kinase 4 n=1 Tax=Porites lobata TaxID=104759 RepID=A0ABN8RS55_9CNID|nr:unnamed protein product [Porites lobata]
MLRNNADAHRCLYFELGLPVINASEKTPQVDVYSFGALLGEMCIRQLPDPQNRNEQVVLVTNGVFRGLLQRCIQRELGARPTMQEIIDELKEFELIS